jgi:mono/diheme cytochrome c family protein
VRTALAALTAFAAFLAAACSGGKTPGERLWRARCAECHGLDARGNTPRFMGNDRADLTDDNWYAYGGDDAGLEAVIREGVFAQMPANADLTSTEMRALIGHLRSLRGEAAE